MKQRSLLLGALVLLGLVMSGCSGGSAKAPLVIYAGRSQTLIQPLLEQFSKDTGIPIKVRYG
ncbi:MAG: iron ABC transporter substrate-binding protein, partial [Chloroflexota bacterium]